MGAWDVRAFDNDEACDWAYGLEEVDDLSLVESALADLEACPDRVDAGLATCALAACEVIARLRGNAGYQDAYTEPVDQWVKAHKITPTPTLIARGLAVIDRVLSNESELAHLWADSPENENWREAMADLRNRLTARPFMPPISVRGRPQVRP